MTAVSIPKELSVGWLRHMYADNRVTPQEVIAEIIRRSEEDADLNIWIAAPSLSRIQPYLDQLSNLDPVNSPLWGIPFAIKDNIDWADVPTTAACPAFAYTPAEHSAAVERLISAGAIPVGKTNLDQFATGLVGTRSPYGETRNALRSELISGGSSSGSAVAVARGQAAFALGTDTAGSGRVPAALNGLVGYKPSLGAWPVKGVLPACASLDCVTVFTRTLKEALEVDGVVRGFCEKDPWSRQLPEPQPRMPRKLCLPKETLFFFGPHAEDYRRAWDSAVNRCTQLGIEIEYIDTEIFEQAAAILYEGPWVSERWAGLGEFIDSHPGATFPVTEQILRSGDEGAYTAVSVFQAIHKLQAYKREVRGLLKDAVLLMPTVGGTWTRDEVRSNPIGTNKEMGRYTNHCNLLDLCAVAVPAGDAAPDTPFGVTFLTFLSKRT